VTTFDASRSPYARTAPVVPASGGAAAPARQTVGAAPAGDGRATGATTDSPVPTPRRHLRAVKNDEPGQTVEETGETPQSPLASGESATPEKAEEGEETAEPFLSTGRLAHLLVPPVRDLVYARPAAVPDLITYAQTGPYAPQTGAMRALGKGFNFAWAVPGNATANLVKWAIFETPSRFAFFSALGFATVKGVGAFDFHWSVLTVIGIVVWLSAAAVIFRFASADSDSQADAE
jgi:hypothetical protein